MKASHSEKRESRLGRWIPVGFYSANIITWLGIGLAASAWDLLPLVLLPLLAVTIYLVRTGSADEP
ncbi:MAG: hypothetical protein PHY16_11565 [Methylobacter sp.]|nr:hypothetical protein [Methylobacter sp.]